MSRSVPIPPSPGIAAPSAITDVTYRNYDGALKTHTFRWWPIAVATIRASVNRKKLGFWIPVGLSFLIYFFLGIMFYFNQNLRQQMSDTGNFMAAGPANPYALSLYQGMISTHLLVVIAAITVGASVIAADNRANALLVYLSKPLTRVDYLVGKWMGVFLLLAALTLTPALLLFLFFAVAYNSDGFLKENPTLILRVIAASLLPAAVHTSLILGFSAWSKTPRLAGALYAALYFITGILAGMVGSVLLQKDTENNNSKMTAIISRLSIDGVTDGIGMSIYDVTPDQIVSRMQGGGRRRRRNPEAEKPSSFTVQERPNLPIMLLIAGVLIAVPLTAAYRKVRAVEVIRG
ncbi:MAG: ABC transporter permease subunit [Armatimonadota bacterium]